MSSVVVLGIKKVLKPSFVRVQYLVQLHFDLIKGCIFSFEEGG